MRIKECCTRHNNFRAFYFKKHAGQTAAMDAGFKHACGKYIVSMDADMQNDPANVPKLLEKLHSYDMVYG